MKTTAFLISMALSGFAIGQKIEGTSNAVAVEIVAKATPAAEEVITLQTLGITKVPKYYALIIGVSEYQNAGPRLKSLEMPAKDAERLANLLIDKYTFDQQDVTLLKSPTREDIIIQFEHLASTVTPRDNVLIFYAGHGVYDKTKDFGWWLPADAKITSPSAWIPNSTIKDYVGAIKSKHTLLIADACFGGSILKASRSVDAVIKQFNELYKDNSRKALTSGNLTEVPDESVFVKYLFKILDENEAVFLPSSVLNTRIYEPILNNSATVPQFGVIQGVGDEGGDFIFIKKK